LAGDRRFDPAMHPQVLFRGRPVHFNPIFVDSFALFPQMDVWSRNAVDPHRQRVAKSKS